MKKVHLVDGREEKENEYFLLQIIALIILKEKKNKQKRNSIKNYNSGIWVI